MAFENNPNATATITVSTPVIIVPAHKETIYTESFELNIGGLPAFQGNTEAYYHGDSEGHSGAGMAEVYQFDAGAMSITSAQTFPLIVGHVYEVSAWVFSPFGPKSAGITVGAQAATMGIAGDDWTLMTTVFTATSTTGSFTLKGTSTGDTFLYFDDVRVVHRVPAVTTLTPTLKLSDGDLALDSGRYPYAQASVEVPLTDEELLEQIKTGQRVTLNATSGDVLGIAANLTLRKRTVSHDAKTIRLDLASDEALLEAWADIADDSTPRTHEANLRNLTNYILNKAIPGASLQAGTANADLTATWDAENLQTNPSAGANLDGWTVSGGTTSRLTGMSVPSTSITTAVRGTMTAGATGGLYFSGGDDSGVSGGVYNVRLSGKQLYRVSAWVRTSVPKTIRLSVQQRNTGNTQSGTNLNGPDFTTTANTWHRLSFVFQAYPDTVRAGVYCYLSSGTWSASQTMDITGVMITEGTTDTPSFDGSTTIRTDLYAYTWDGTPHLSTSKRTALVERSPELFTWRAGENAWKFLEPLTAAAGFRLFCDEQRRWWLIDPVDYSVPGRFSARPDNTVQGTDTIDADDDESGYDGVVATFRWTDADGLTQVAKDAAGIKGKVKPLEFTTPYPGPGVAAAHLAKIQGLGRVQDVTTRTDYTVRPGQEIQIDLPGTYPQLGTLARVKWELTTGLQTLGSARLRETPPGAIDLLNGIIDALPGSIDSLT
ncbi:carbohydrate binding domain-containing protein [Microbacterium sp. LWH10-1.2]|uniref:carbohydrate binding domain-containing protein n=1 Tax=Microbacterium sp. LWH10-1.2 TaxID=3135255 RepID=UPI00313893F0